MMRVQIWHIVHTCWLISVYLLVDFSRLWQRLPVLGLDLLGFADYASSKPPRAHKHQELVVRRSGMPSPPPVFNFLSRCCEALNIAFLSMLLSMHFAFKPVFGFPLQFRTLPLGSPRSPSLLLLLTPTSL